MTCNPNQSKPYALYRSSGRGELGAVTRLCINVVEFVGPGETTRERLPTVKAEGACHHRYERVHNNNVTA